LLIGYRTDHPDFIVSADFGYLVTSTLTTDLFPRVIRAR
jgi:hypothetical protein